MLFMMTPSHRVPNEIKVHLKCITVTTCIELVCWIFALYKMLEHIYVPLDINLSFYIDKTDPILVNVQERLCQMIYRYLSSVR